MCELVFYTNCLKPNACERTLSNKYGPSEMPLGQSNARTHTQVGFFFVYVILLCYMMS